MDILNLFGINPLLLAAQVVNFLILLFILKKFLYGPILKVLATRKETISQSLKNAEEIERRLAGIADKEIESIQTSAKEGENLIKQATESSVRIIEEGRKKYEEIIKSATEDAKQFTQGEKVKLQQEIKENLADLVVTTLQKVLGRTISKTDEKAAIIKAIKEIEA